MERAEIPLVCGLIVHERCWDMLCMNSDVDETLAYWESR